MRDLAAEKQLEFDIETVILHWHAATTPSDRRKCFNELKRLKELRSVEKIRELELERGLV